MINKQKNREINLYFRQIKTLLPIYGKEEKQFIRHLRTDMEEYIDAQPSCSWEQVLEQFESPQEAVHGYLSAQDPEKIYKKLKIRKFVFFTLLSIAALIIAYYCIADYLYQGIFQAIRQQGITKEPTIIIE